MLRSSGMHFHLIFNLPSRHNVTRVISCVGRTDVCAPTHALCVWRVYFVCVRVCIRVRISGPCTICYKLFRNISRGMPRAVIIRSQRNYTKTMRSRLQLHPRVDILIRQLSKNDTNIDDCWLDRLQIFMTERRQGEVASRALINRLRSARVRCKTPFRCLYRIIPFAILRWIVCIYYEKVSHAKVCTRLWHLS